jgi:hypothetical protein
VVVVVVVVVVVHLKHNLKRLSGTE